jgi:hypothetical protein
MARIKRIKSIVVTILAWGILAYAGYSIAIVIVAHARATGALASASPVFVDNAAGVYLAPDCLNEWLNRSPAASPLKETNFGEAYRLRYRRFDCNNRGAFKNEPFEEMRLRSSIRE